MIADADTVEVLVELDTPDGAVASRSDETTGNLVAYPEPDGVWAMSSEFVAARWEDGRQVERLYMGSVPGVRGLRDGRTLMAARLGDLLTMVGERPDGRQEVVLVRLERGEVTDLGVTGRVVNFGFSGDGSVVALAYIDGTIRLLDVARAEPMGVVWSGTGTFVGEPGWFDESTDMLWMGTAGKLIEVPLDPDRWVERACAVASRELTSEEWERLVPGDEAQRRACD